MTETGRINWVDYSKGICIVLVVFMHSTLGVEKVAGSLSAIHGFVDWAKPFRMPDFFMISGLFLARRIQLPWRAFVDTKVLHFAYFYLVWMTIQFLAKGPGVYLTEGSAVLVRQYLLGLIEPFGTLWFIYLLPIFFIVTKASTKLPPIWVFAGSCLLEVMTTAGLIETGHVVIDEFAARFVYFFAGYWLSGYIFAYAELARSRTPPVLFASLVIWGTANLILVKTGLAAWPLISLILGFAGSLAVVSFGVILSSTRLCLPLRYCGQNSIVIYLAFFLFMAATRVTALRLFPGLNLSAIAFASTFAGVLGPLVLFWITRGTLLNFLFYRPTWAKLAAIPQGWHIWLHAAKPIRDLHPQTRRPS